MAARAGWIVIVALCLSCTEAAAQAPIYRCETNGTTTFSDRPCGRDARVAEIDTSRVSTFAPVPAGKVDMPKAKRTKSSGNSVAQRKDRCISIRASLRKIDDRLREGYSAKEGNRLEARKRELRQQGRELRC